MSRLIFLLFLIGAHSLLLGQELNRRAFLGVQLSSLSDSAAKANNIPKGNGVLILQVFPASSASAADLRKGDIILAVDQAVVRGVAGFLGQIKAYEAGDNANLQIMRTGQKQTLDLVFKPMSGEEYDNASVQYDAVKGPSGLLRTILTLPEGAKNPPVLYIIQGIDCGSIDIAFQPSSSYRRLIDACHEAGIATFRVEKSGVGDSKGTACRDCDFMEDAEGFLAGLKQLKKDKTIDAEKIYLLGISMGGVWAPWMASQKSVAGIIAYGTIGRPLNEYLLENSRRQAILRGTDFVDIEEDRKLDARLYHYLFEERMSPQAVMSEHPDLSARLLQISREAKQSEVEHLFADRNYQFHQQLQHLNLSQSWNEVDGRVLIVWGKGDFVSAREDHILIEQVVNADQQDQAEFVEVDANHWFQQANDMPSAYAARLNGENPPINLEVFKTFTDWIMRDS